MGTRRCRNLHPMDSGESGGTRVTLCFISYRDKAKGDFSGSINYTLKRPHQNQPRGHNLGPSGHPLRQGSPWDGVGVMGQPQGWVKPQIISQDLRESSWGPCTKQSPLCHPSPGSPSPSTHPNTKPSKGKNQALEVKWNTKTQHHPAGGRHRLCPLTAWRSWAWGRAGGAPPATPAGSCSAPPAWG